MRKLRWNTQPVLNVLMTLAIVLIAFPALKTSKEIPMAINSPAFTSYVLYDPAPSAAANPVNFTYSAWVYSTANSPVTGRPHYALAAYDASLSLSVGFGLRKDATYADVIFQYTWSSGAGQWHTTGFTIENNVLYHIAVSYNNSSSDNDPTIYINGVAQSVTEDSAPSGTPLVTNDFRVARNYIIVPDFRVYPFIATAADIANMYASRCTNVHPAQGLPVFQPILYGAAGVQNFDGVVLAAGNVITDPYSGARGVPTGNPVGVADTYLSICP